MGRRVSVAAGDRVEVRFPGRATRAGTARVQIAATAGARSDAAQLELPVYTPATAEAFATYGVVDAGAIRLPLRRRAMCSPASGAGDRVQLYGRHRADRRLPVPAKLPLRGGGAHRLPCTGQCRAARCAIRFPHGWGAGLRHARGKHAAGHRADRRAAKSGRRLGLLASRGRILAIHQHPRRACAGAGPCQGVHRSAGNARPREQLPA